MRLCEQVFRQMRFVVCCLVSLCAWSPLWAQDGKSAEIAHCVRQNFPERSAHHRITIISHDANERLSRMQAHMFWRPSGGEQNRIHVRLEEPADLAGSAYLLVQTPEQESLFLYVPGLNRVRRLRGQAMAGELWGTSLNYHDFRYLYGIALNSDFVWEGESQQAGLDQDKLRADIPPAGGWGHSAVRVFVERQHCVVTRVEFLDAADQVLKLLEVDPASIQRVDGHWMPFRLEVVDLAHDARVEVTVNSASFDHNLPTGLFESRSFYRTLLPPSP